jgi:hypothetical protein
MNLPLVLRRLIHHLEVRRKRVKRLKNQRAKKKKSLKKRINQKKNTFFPAWRECEGFILFFALFFFSFFVL